jgi:transposase
LTGIPQGRYTREFRQKAIKLVVEDKISCREATQRLSLAPSTLAYCVRAYKEGKLVDVGKAQKPLTEGEMYLVWTRR